MTEKKRQNAGMAILYEIRLIPINGGKEQYTAEQTAELIDKIALSKQQET